MPKVKRSRKRPPEGWELIEPTLDELDQKMREAETETHEGKGRLRHYGPYSRSITRSPGIYMTCFIEERQLAEVMAFNYAELYEYCLNEGYADKNLIAKWKKPGYENLCCLRCIQPRDTNFGTNCVCRVPKSKLESGKIVECVHCGCRGCSG